MVLSGEFSSYQEFDVFTDFYEKVLVVWGKIKVVRVIGSSSDWKFELLLEVWVNGG